MTLSRRRAGAGALALIAMAAPGALSRVPYAAGSGDQAVIRLAWRARGEQVRECRRLTAGELERLPVHIRYEEECSRRIAPYGLQEPSDHATPAVVVLDTTLLLVVRRAVLVTYDDERGRFTVLAEAPSSQR